MPPAPHEPPTPARERAPPTATRRRRRAPGARCRMARARNALDRHGALEATDADMPAPEHFTHATAAAVPWALSASRCARSEAAPGVPAADVDQRGRAGDRLGRRTRSSARRSARAPDGSPPGRRRRSPSRRCHRTAVGSRVACSPLLRRIGSEVRPPTVNSRAVAPGTPDRDLVVERPRTADRVDEIDLRWFGRLRFLLRLPESAGGGSP